MFDMDRVGITVELLQKACLFSYKKLYFIRAPIGDRSLVNATTDHMFDESVDSVRCTSPKVASDATTMDDESTCSTE